MLDELQLVNLPLPIQSHFQKLEQDIMIKIAERIKKIGTLSSTDLHKLEELGNIGFDLKSIEKDIANTLEMSERDIRRIFFYAAEQEYNGMKETMLKLHKDFIPFAENERLQTLVESMSRATAKSFVNMSATTGFVNARNKRGVILPAGEWQSLPKYYQNVIDYATTQIRTGRADFYSAMRSTMKSMADRGLTFVEYENGYIRRLDTSVRSAMLGGQARLSHAQAEIIGEQIGADGYEITLHLNPRPSHEWIGGIQVDKKTYESKVLPLMQEPNCYHRSYSIILGISTPAYTKKQIEELNAKGRKVHEFEGEKFNGYEASQRQRQYETAIRRQKDRALVFKASGDKQGEKIAKGKATAINQEYKRFSEAMNLEPRPIRATVSGYTRGKQIK